VDAYRLQRERQHLIEDGFKRDPSFLGWSMTTHNGQVFTVSERELRAHTGRLPVIWRWDGDLGPERLRTYGPIT